MSNKDVKDDYSYWSENLHSAYLFYTMEVDKLNKQNNRLREALELITKVGHKNSCEEDCILHKSGNKPHGCAECMCIIAVQALK